MHRLIHHQLMSQITFATIANTSGLLESTTTASTSFLRIGTSTFTAARKSQDLETLESGFLRALNLLPIPSVVELISLLLAMVRQYWAATWIQ